MDKLTKIHEFDKETERLEEEINAKLCRESYRGSPLPAPMPHIFVNRLKKRHQYSEKMKNDFMENIQKSSGDIMIDQVNKSFPDVESHHLHIKHIVTSHSGGSTSSLDNRSGTTHSSDTKVHPDTPNIQSPPSS